MGGFSSSLGTLNVGIVSGFDERGFEELEKEFANAEQAMGELERQIDQIANNASADFERIGKAEGLSQLAGNIDKQISEAEKKFEGLEKIGDRLTGAGTKLSLALTAPLVGFGAAALKASGDFESAMNKVSAQGDITGKDLEALKAQAEDLGAKTQFSSRQAAEGMAELAAAGFKTNEVMQAMPGVLNLAAAAGTDVGQAAKTAKDLLGQFGLAAADTGRVVDILAKAGTESSGTLGEMANSLEYAGPIAKSLGMSLEETSAALLVLDKAGIRGEQSGTALRGMLSSLLKPSKDAAELMDKLKISVKDTSGNFLPFAAIMEQFRQKLDTIPGSAERGAALVTIFGQEAASASSILTKEGAPALLEFQRRLEDSGGTAQRVAETMQQGLGGALERMKGSIETAAQKIGEQLAPSIITLAGYVEQAANKIAEFAKWFQTLPGWVQDTALAFIALSAAIGPILIGLGQFAKTVVLINSLLPLTKTGVDGVTAAVKISAGEFALWTIGITAAAAALAVTLKAAYDNKQAQKGLAEGTEESARRLVILENHLRAAGKDVDALKDQLDRGQISVLKYNQELARMGKELGDTKKKTEDIKPPLTELEKLQAELSKALEDASKAAEANSGALDKNSKAAKKAAKEHADAAKRVQEAWIAAWKRNEEAVKDTQKQIDWFAATYAKLDQMNKDLAKSNADLATNFAKSHEEMRKASLKPVEITKTFEERIPESIRVAIKAVQDLEAAYKKLGIESPRVLDQTADETRKAYELIYADANASIAMILEAWIKMEEARIKAQEVTVGAILHEERKLLEEAKKTLKELTGETEKETKKQETIWKKMGEGIRDVFKDFVEDVFKRLVFGSKFNEQLEEEETGLRESLAERTAEWEEYLQGVSQQQANMARDYAEALAEEETALADSLAERAQEHADFVAEHTSDYERETRDLDEALAERAQDYSDYADEVARNITQIEEDHYAAWQRESDELFEQLAERAEDYDDWVSDANKSLQRLGEDTEDNIQDETQDTRKGIRERQKDYDRYAEDVARKIERLREKNKGQVSEEEQDLLLSLQRRKEDLDQFIADENAALAEYTEEQRQRQAREEEDLRQSMERKKRDHDQYVDGVKEKFRTNENNYRESLAREVGEQQTSLTERKGQLDQFVLDTKGKQEEITAKHKSELDKEQGDYDKFVTDATAASERRKGEIIADYESETTALNTELAKQKAEYDAFVLDITGPGGKLEQLKEAHRTVWNDIADIAKGSLGQIASSILSIAGEEVLGKLASKLGEVFGIASKAGEGLAGTVGGAGQAAGGAGGIAGGAAGAGISGIVSAVSGVVSAITGVVGIFQSAKQETTLNAIEHNTRYSMMYLGERADQGILGRLFDIADKMQWVPGLLDGINQKLNDWLEPIKTAIDLMQPDLSLSRISTQAIESSLGYIKGLMETDRNNLQAIRDNITTGGNWTVTFQGDPIARMVGEEIMRQLRLQGVNLVPGVVR